MNSHLRLKSAILYNRDVPLHLEQPDLAQVYKEAKETIENRNRVLDKHIRIRLIEKSIHQFCILPYKVEKIPLFVKNNIMKLNPSYFYNLYTTKTIEEILPKYPVIQKKYLSMNNALGCHRKDLLMMLVLYEQGGIYFDLDQEPLSPFDEILSDVSFATSIPLKYEDGINLGFIACNRGSPIMKMMLDDFLQYDYDMIAILGYACLCKRAGEILKRYMNVDRLTEGVHYVKGEKILLGREVGEDHISCRITFQGKVLCNTRYKDYPWDLAK
jgi:mannosyltransferase OCH1-like enzyme